MEPVLKFVNVNKYYNNNVHALHNISLEILWKLPQGSLYR